MTADLREDHKHIIEGILAECFGYEGDFEATRLGGITNFNYMVTAPEHCIVVRIPGDGTESLVDREVECEITYAAGRIGVENTPLYFDPKTGIKAMPCISNAVTMHQDTLRDPENFTKAAELFRKLHESDEKVSFRFDVYEMIPHYEEKVRELREIEWDGYDGLREKLFSLRDRMSAGGIAFCHCDPICENFVVDGDNGKMYLIDWEYAGMNDPLWDVADFIIECDYSREERNAFQEAYFGRPATQDEDERISINIVLIDFLWALWGLQRSWFDHSLDDYGIERYERALRNFDEFNLCA